MPTKKLNTFIYTGKNKFGAEIKGEIVALNPVAAKSQLRRQQIDVVKIRKKTDSLFSMGQKKVDFTDVVLFARHLATMLAAGLPLVQTLDGLSRSHNKPKMRELLDGIKQDVSSGKTLSASLSKHSEHFDELFCNLVHIGEETGTLDTILDRMATYLEKTEALRKKIKKALLYPGAILITSLTLSSALLLFVIPQFEDLFSSFDAKLPGFTLAIMHLSEIMRAHWYGILIPMIIAIYMFKRFKRTSAKFRLILDRYILKIPIVGEVARKGIIARFSRTLAITLAAGLPISDALRAVANTLGNQLYSHATMQVRQEIMAGQPINVALSSTRLFPSMMTQMVEVGEESGAVEEMLDKVASYYEDDVDNTVSGLSGMIEPIIMVIIGLIVGVFIIAMYLPIFKMSSIF